jgi:hypothetical protein
MMSRHDPLSTPAPAPEADPAPPPAPKHKAKLPPLLRELANVPDDTLLFLDGRSRAGRSAPEVRAEFTAWCEAHSHYANWRQAWAGYDANLKVQHARLATVTPTFAPTVRFVPDVTPLPAAPVQTPLTPLWLQHARQRAAARYR